MGNGFCCKNPFKGQGMRDLGLLQKIWEDDLNHST